MTASASLAPGRTRLPEFRFGVALALIALAGLILRVAYVIWTRGNPLPLDGLHYHYRAQALADGRGLVNPLVQQLTNAAEAPPDASNPPAWSLLLAVPTRLGLRSILSHQLFACLVGAATIAMTGVAGRAAFGRRAALIAAAIVAVYPYLWLYERELMAESLTLLGIATCIWLSYRFLAKPGPWLALALGVTVGLLALTRAEQIALLPLLVLPLIVFRRAVDCKRRIAWLGIAGIASIAMILSWTLYNTTRFEHPVVLSTGLGSAMQAGNCASTYEGRFLGYYDNSIFNWACVPPGISGEPSIADRQLRESALTFMGDHLSEVPVVVAARIGRTFSVFRPFQQIRFEHEDRKTSLDMYRVGLFTYWLLLPLAIVGSVAARRRKIKIYPLLVSFGVVALSVAVTIGAARYRGPAEVPLALLAGFGILAMIEHRPRRSVPAVPELRPQDPELIGAAT
jgi:4-amino-4-deoxy-L-arabinose transferase-like glycosyltransferase